MTIRHIKIFKAICENGYNITKASQQLNMTQPAVSMAIKELETYYGVKLFDRIGRRLSITKAGEKLLDYSVRISSVFDDMEIRLKDWDTHAAIRIGATSTPGGFMLPEWVKKFKESHPLTPLKINISTCYGLEEKLLNGDIDFAIIEGELHSPALIHYPFADDRLCVVSGADCGYTNGQHITIEEFKNLNFITKEKKCVTRRLFDSITAKAGFSVNPYIESSDIPTLVNFAISGAGVAVIPYRAVEIFIKRGRLCEIVCPRLDLSRKLYIVTSKDKYLSTAAKEFIELCKNT